jgi:hypothetical protein
MAIAPDIRIPSFVFFCVLGPLFFRSPLYRLVLTREISLCLQLPKANKILAHLALLVGREALSRWGGGGGPSPAPPSPAPLRGTWLGYAQPEASKKSPPSAEDRG